MKIFKKKREDEAALAAYPETSSLSIGINSEEFEAESGSIEGEDIANAKQNKDEALEDANNEVSTEAESQNSDEAENKGPEEAENKKSEESENQDSDEAEEEEPEPQWECPAGMEKAFEFLTDAGWPAGKQKPSAELLEVVSRGLIFEESVRQAAAEGEVRGRNVRIHECFMTPDSDGVPHLGSQGSLRGARVRATSIFDVARSANS